MALLKFRRRTAAQAATEVLPAGTLVWLTDSLRWLIHDGLAAGGLPLNVAPDLYSAAVSQLTPSPSAPEPVMALAADNLGATIVGKKDASTNNAGNVTVYEEVGGQNVQVATISPGGSLFVPRRDLSKVKVQTSAAGDGARCILQVPSGSTLISLPSGVAYTSTWQPAQDIGQGGITWSDINTGSNSEMRVFATSDFFRLPASMAVYKFTSRIRCDADLTEMRFEIWRKDSGAATYSRVAQSENLIAQLAPQDNSVRNIEFTLATPLWGKGGDVPCLMAKSSIATQNFIQVSSSADATNCRYLSSANPSGVNNTLSTLANTAFVPLYVHGTKAHIAIFGDSQAAGDHDGQGTVAMHAETVTGLRCLHRGIGSQNSASIRSRVGASGGAVGVTDLGIPIVWCPGGLGGGIDFGGIADPNDPGQVAAAKATYLSNVTAILDALAAAGCKTVLGSINPGTGWSDTLSAIRRDWNTALAALCAARPSNQVLFINLDPVIGQIRPSTGELDDFAYPSDGPGFHLYKDGLLAEMNYFWSSFKAWAHAQRFIV